MTKKLTKRQAEVWDRLKNGIPPPEIETWSVRSSSMPPSPPTPGTVYYDTNLSVMRVYDGTQWKNII